jgi:hypothetical protein
MISGARAKSAKTICIRETPSIPIESLTHMLLAPPAITPWTSKPRPPAPRAFGGRCSQQSQLFPHLRTMQRPRELLNARCQLRH